MNPAQIDGIAKAVVNSLGPIGPGPLGCGAISNPDRFSPALFICTDDYECGGAALFLCSALFSCEDLPFSCLTNFSCDPAYKCMNAFFGCGTGLFRCYSGYEE